MRLSNAVLACAAASIWFGASTGAAPADEALRALIEGNARFVAGAPTNPNSGLERVSETAAGQHPFVTVLGCADSRAPVERIFDQGIGDVFVIRVAGNVAAVNEIGTAEYGTAHLGTPLIVVLGHTKCGAVSAVVEGAEVHGNIPALVSTIVPAVEATRAAHPDADNATLIPLAIHANVLQSMEDILTHSEVIAGLIEQGQVRMVGALYDIATGEVVWIGEHPEQAALLEAAAAPAGH